MNDPKVVNQAALIASQIDWFGGPFTAADIKAGSGLGLRDINRHLSDLVALGDLVVIAPPSGITKTFCPRNKLPEGVKPIENGSLRGTLWATLRRMKTCIASDLAVHATTSDIRVGVEDAQAFLSQLLRAGYVRCERTARPGVREAAYRLIRDTGPKAPMLKRTTVMIDPNLLGAERITFVGGGMP